MTSNPKKDIITIKPKYNKVITYIILISGKLTGNKINIDEHVKEFYIFKISNEIIEGTTNFIKKKNCRFVLEFL